MCVCILAYICMCFRMSLCVYVCVCGGGGIYTCMHMYMYGGYICMYGGMTCVNVFGIFIDLYLCIELPFCCLCWCCTVRIFDVNGFFFRSNNGESDQEDTDSEEEDTKSENDDENEGK